MLADRGMGQAHHVGAGSFIDAVDTVLGGMCVGPALAREASATEILRLAAGKIEAGLGEGQPALVPTRGIDNARGDATVGYAC
jgi:hypothetical protein